MSSAISRREQDELDELLGNCISELESHGPGLPTKTPGRLSHTPLNGHPVPPVMSNGHSHHALLNGSNGTNGKANGYHIYDRPDSGLSTHVYSTIRRPGSPTTSGLDSPVTVPKSPSISSYKENVHFNLDNNQVIGQDHRTNGPIYARALSDSTSQNTYGNVQKSRVLFREPDKLDELLGSLMQSVDTLPDYQTLSCRPSRSSSASVQNGKRAPPTRSTSYGGASNRSSSAGDHSPAKYHQQVGPESYVGGQAAAVAPTQRFLTRPTVWSAVEEDMSGQLDRSRPYHARPDCQPFTYGVTASSPVIQRRRVHSESTAYVVENKPKPPPPVRDTIPTTPPPTNELEIHPIYAKVIKRGQSFNSKTSPASPRPVHYEVREPSYQVLDTNNEPLSSPLSGTLDGDLVWDDVSSCHDSQFDDPNLTWLQRQQMKLKVKQDYVDRGERSRREGRLLAELGRTVSTRRVPAHGETNSPSRETSPGYQRPLYVQTGLQRQVSAPSSPGPSRGAIVAPTPKTQTIFASGPTNPALAGSTLSSPSAITKAAIMRQRSEGAHDRPNGRPDYGWSRGADQSPSPPPAELGIVQHKSGLLMRGGQQQQQQAAPGTQAAPMSQQFVQHSTPNRAHHEPPAPAWSPSSFIGSQSSPPVSPGAANGEAGLAGVATDRPMTPGSGYFGHGLASHRSSMLSLADSAVISQHPRTVKDTTSLWYRPRISRDEAIELLVSAAPGAFIVRDSNSFPGAFGLALKVAAPPPGEPSRPFSVKGEEFVRHFLIEPHAKGVRIKGCPNEPVFGSLSALVYQHSLTPLALPCRLVLQESDTGH